MKIDDRIEKALLYLVETDDLAANLKAEMLKAEQRHKSTIDAYFVTLEGPVEQRKAKARQKAEPVYSEYLDALAAYETVANKRRTESIVIDACRTLCANRRQGSQIT